jgi:hypothetical protein
MQTDAEQKIAIRVPLAGLTVWCPLNEESEYATQHQQAQTCDSHHSINNGQIGRVEQGVMKLNSSGRQQRNDNVIAMRGALPFEVSVLKHQSVETDVDNVTIVHV